MADKLTICKTCGKEIVQSARCCPSCSSFRPPIARHPVGGSIVVGICVILFCVILFRFAAPGKDTKPGEPATSVSATELWSAYQENGARADELYNGKLLSVSGEVFNISTFMGMQCVTLLVDNPTYCDGMICLFPKGESVPKVSDLKNGDTVTLYGICSGTEMGGATVIMSSPATMRLPYVYLNDCSFDQ